MTTANGNKLNKATIILDLRFHRPGMVRSGSLDDVTVDADKGRLHLVKRIVDSPLYRQINTMVNKCRQEIDRKYGLASFLKRGTYRIPASLVEEVYEVLRGYKADYDSTVDEFIDNYPVLVGEAEFQLRSQFRAADYPTIDYLRRAFSMEWSIYETNIPSDGKLAEFVYEEEKAKAKAAWAQNEADVRQALRACMLSLVERLAASLEVRADASVCLWERDAFSAAALC